VREHREQHGRIVGLLAPCGEQSIAIRRRGRERERGRGLGGRPRDHDRRAIDLVVVEVGAIELVARGEGLVGRLVLVGGGRARPDRAGLDLRIEDRLPARVVGRGRPRAVAAAPRLAGGERDELDAADRGRRLRRDVAARRSRLVDARDRWRRHLVDRAQVVAVGLGARRARLVAGRLGLAADLRAELAGLGAQLRGVVGRRHLRPGVECARQPGLAIGVRAQLLEELAAIVEAAGGRRVGERGDRVGVAPRAHERRRERGDVGRAPALGHDRGQRLDGDLPREVRARLGREQAQRRVPARAGAERIRGGAHRLAPARGLVDEIVADVGELEQRVAARRAGLQLRERLEVARGRVVIAELARELDELAQQRRIAGADVVRGLERRERLVELAVRLRAGGRVAQRQRAAARVADAPTRGVVLGGRLRGAGRIATQARERGADRGGRVDPGTLEGRQGELAHGVELRVIERRDQLGEGRGRELALAGDDREIDAGIARQVAGELREPTGGGDHLAGVAQLVRREAQRRAPRRIDLERALVGRERDIRPPELRLQIAEPRQQRLLARGVARGRRDLAAEDHRDPLEIAAIAPRGLERVERGQVHLGDPQRGLEAADRVVGALGAAEQLARAIHRVGARALRAVVREGREALECTRGARELARALGEVGVEAEHLAAHLRGDAARELVVGLQRAGPGGAPHQGLQRRHRERRVAGAIGGDREPVVERAHPWRLGAGIGEQAGVRADHVGPRALAPRGLAERDQHLAAQRGRHVGVVGLERGVRARAVGQGGGGLVGGEPGGGGGGLELDALGGALGELRERRERLRAGAAIAALREQLGLELVGATPGVGRDRVAVVLGELQGLVEIRERGAEIPPGRRRQAGALLLRCALLAANVRAPDEQHRALEAGRPRREHGIDPPALGRGVVARALEHRARRVARELRRVPVREGVRALPVRRRERRLAGTIEQRGAQDRELGGARVEAVLVAARILAREIDERHDRGVELGGRVVAIRRRLGDLGEHGVGLGGGLATGERGAAQARAGLVDPRQRDERTRERELEPRGLELRQADGPHPLVERRGGRVIVRRRRVRREPRERVGLQRFGLERARPRERRGDADGVVLRALREQVAERRPRAPARAGVAAGLGEPRHLAPRLDGRARIARREDARGHLVDRRILRGERARRGELLLRARVVAELVDEHVGEPEPQLHGARGVRRARGAGAHEPHELGPPLLVGEPIGERVGGLGGARIVLERELVELGRGLGLEHAQQPRPGERGERRLIVVALGARELRDLGQVRRRLARVALRERDRRERRVRGRELRPATERLARELEPVEEPRGARRRDREDALEQQRLVRAVRREQRAIAAHRVLEVTLAELLIDRVHEVVRRRERLRDRRHAELGAAGPCRTVRDVDAGAGHPHAGQLDVRDRGEPPAARRHQVPQHGADEIDLDVAQPARVRPLDDAGRVGRAEQRRQDAIRDHRTGRRQVTVHADVRRERAQVRAGVDELDAERQVGRGEPVGGAPAHRDVAVGDPRRDLREPEPGQLPADVLDALLDRVRAQPDREAAQPRAPALEPLGGRLPGIGAEVGDLELEALDHERPDRQLRERELAHAAARLEAERQAARARACPLEHGA